MRKITELTRDEIIALTDQDLQRMMDYECAENGIALLPLPEKPVIEKHEEDQKYYEIGDMCFLTLADAERVMEAINGVQVFKDSYDYSIGYDHKYLEPQDGKFEIIPKMCFSRDVFDSIRVKLSKQKELSTQYEKDLANYQKAQKQRESVCGYILDAYYKAHDEVSEEKRLREKFEQYLGLANGDRSTAMRFLRKVETVPAELAEELAPEIPVEGRVTA